MCSSFVISPLALTGRQIVHHVFDIKVCYDINAGLKNRNAVSWYYGILRKYQDTEMYQYIPSMALSSVAVMVILKEHKTTAGGNVASILLHQNTINNFAQM